MSLTRWQSFRRRQQQQHGQQQRQHSSSAAAAAAVVRNNIQQVLYLIGFGLLIGLYTYAFFFCCQSDDRYSHATIERWNTALQQKAHIEFTERRAKRIRAKELREEEQQKKNKQQQDGSTNEDDDDENNSKQRQKRREKRTFADRLMDMILVSYVMSFLLRVYARLYYSEQHPQQWWRNSSSSSSSSTGGGRSLFRHRRRLQHQRLRREQQQQQRFQQWAARLNAQRIANQQPPISLASLELVMRERDMTGNDYDSLLQFEAEALLLNHGGLLLGASQDEINRCPVRTLEPGDELLQQQQQQQQRTRIEDDDNHHHDLSPATPHFCAICLEQYQAGDRIRTIPCFHSFHKDCVDPWLAQRAVCPVCKHSAVG